MNLLSLIGMNGQVSAKTTEIPAIWPMDMPLARFVDTDVDTIYLRILTDVLERTYGLKEKEIPLLWDNCLGSEVSDGLVSMLAKAMTRQEDLFIVYDKALEVVRRATSQEQTTIRTDYQKNNESGVGFFVTFKNFDRAKMVRLYSAIDYMNICGLWKTMNLSTAIQFKMNDMRASTALGDSEVIAEQAVAMARALGQGKNVLMDGKDSIETAKPDLAPIQLATDLLTKKQAFYLGLPAAWITGLSGGGLSDTGNADARAVERGLKAYYFSVIKPVVEAIFDVTTSFKSDDTGLMAVGLQALKDFDVTSDDHLSKDNKTIVINKLFGLPENEEGDEPEEPVAPTTPPVVTPVPAPAK